MPKFKNGIHVNKGKRDRFRYKRLRISAGPCRGKYLDVLILEAKLGRKLKPGMTVEHMNGNSMDCRPQNLIEVPMPNNTSLMHSRTKDPNLQILPERLYSLAAAISSAALKLFPR